MHKVALGNVISRFSMNSEDRASEFVENIEEMFLCCYVYIDGAPIINYTILCHP